ncbi:MAG TPA: hypothetical protein VE010_19845, partial [Thermoanaerobaculia bacterium]|nr:hypothetical protein [Thermoanaerobaculia bacterium]
AVTNDVSGLKFLAIEFAAGGYTVSGSPLATTDGRITSPAPGSTVACDLAVTGQLEITGVTLSGAVSGTGGLFVNGGYVTFSGAKANTYSGATVVHAASLTLQKPADVVAVPGDLTSSSSLIFAEAAGLIADGSHLAGSGEDNWLNLRGDQTVRSIKGFGVAPLGGKQPRLTVTKLGGGGDLLVNVTLKEGPVDVPAGMTLKVKDLQVPVSGLTITGGGSVQFFTSAIVPLQIDGPSANVTAPYTTVTLLRGAFHGTAGSLIATGGTVTYAASAGDLRFGPAVTVALEGGKFSLNGTLDLGGATVQWPTAWADVAMPPVVAISNQSAAAPIGTFAGVVEGVKTASGFVVNYHGGDGNDVTIVRPRADDAKQRAAVAFTYEPSPVHAGKPVSLRATFSGPGAVPTGTVTCA